MRLKRTAFRSWTPLRSGFLTCRRADSILVGSLVVVDRSFVAANARELARMRAVVSRLSDRQLGAMVNEYWSVAGGLGHIAFWDGRALYLAGKLERGAPFTAAGNQPRGRGRMKG